MKKILLLLIALPLVSFSAAHKFYVSATDIQYDKDSQALQIISHVFTDDLQKLLKERYNEELFLLKKGEHPDADAFVKRYFQDKIQIGVDGKRKQLHYVGKEYDKDQLLVYLEVKDVKPFDNIWVENAVLTDLFPDQKNVVKVEHKGEIKSLLLGRHDPNGSLNFRD